LELEAQELQASSGDFDAGKGVAPSTVQLQEQQAKSHLEDSTRIQKLESTLKDIELQFMNKFRTFIRVGTQLTDEYEAKLKAVKGKYDEAQQDAETLADEVEAQKENFRKLENEYTRFRTRQRIS
jgi:chromosome segregation ATPase